MVHSRNLGRVGGRKSPKAVRHGSCADTGRGLGGCLGGEGKVDCVDIEEPRGPSLNRAPLQPAALGTVSMGLHGRRPLTSTGALVRANSVYGYSKSVSVLQLCLALSLRVFKAQVPPGLDAWMDLFLPEKG